MNRSKSLYKDIVRRTQNANSNGDKRTKRPI
jgi:hypothetical protein